MSPYFSVASSGLIPSRAAEVEDGVVRYEWARHSRRVLPPPTLLAEFMEIGRSDDVAGDIRSFVTRYGGLGLCREHSRPFGHVDHDPLATLAGEVRPCAGRMDVRFDHKHGLATHEETLTSWVSWANRFRTVFNAAAAVRFSLVVTTPLDWSYLLGHRDAPRQSDRPLKGEAVWRTISAALNWWFADCRVAPVTAVGRHGGLEVSLGRGGSSPLFGELTLQLLSAVAGGRGFLICDGCGTPFQPQRKRAASRAKFCSSCGLTAAWSAGAMIPPARRPCRAA